MNAISGDSLAIQSWCFRGLGSAQEIIAALKACGVSRVELCDLHINPFSPDYPRVARQYADAGITIAGYGVHGFDGDVEKSRKVFEMARALGLRAITGTFSPPDLPSIEPLCQEYDMRLAIHNHGRLDIFGTPFSLQQIFRQSSPYIGLCLDTGWMLDCGVDPIEVAKTFRDRLYALHVKDFVFDRAGRPQDTISGEGNLDLAALAAFLVETEFDGDITLEYEGDVDNPIPATRTCVEAVRAALTKAAKNG